MTRIPRVRSPDTSRSNPAQFPGPPLLWKNHARMTLPFDANLTASR